MVTGTGQSMLFCSIMVAGAAFDIVVAHAPHTGVRSARRRAWWQAFTDKVASRPDTRRPLFVPMGGRARVGAHQHTCTRPAARGHRVVGERVPVKDRLGYGGDRAHPYKSSAQGRLHHQIAKQKGKNL